MKYIYILFNLFAIFFVNSALGWGIEGHAVVAEIASKYLEKDAAQEINYLLRIDGAKNMAEVASWADEVRGEDLSFPMHSVRIPLNHSNYRPEKDCPENKCALAGLDKFYLELGNRCLSDKERIVALKFIIHLIGDIHQPLHASIDTGQRMVILLDKTYTLHKVWDTLFFRRIKQTPRQIAEEIDKSYSYLDVVDSPVDWAIQGRDIARDKVFSNLPQDKKIIFKLSNNYLAENYPIVRYQVYLAGIRLASYINKSLLLSSKNCMML